MSAKLDKRGAKALREEANGASEKALTKTGSHQSNYSDKEHASKTASKQKSKCEPLDNAKIEL